MSNLVEHAKTELDIAGLKQGEGPYDGMLRDSIINMIEVFSEQGHSGMSAGMVSSALQKLLRFEPMTPLTGEDEEWVEVMDGCLQNKRCGRVFKSKETGEAYDIDGRVFEDPDGSRWTNGESRVAVTFPYMPTTEVVKRS